MYQILGLIGSVLAGVAYLPQIIHLIKEKCAAGISLTANLLWGVSAILLLANAINSKSLVFGIFHAISLVAISLILFFGKKYQTGRCPTHKHQS